MAWNAAEGRVFCARCASNFGGACNLARESECYVMEIITLSLSLSLSLERDDVEEFLI